MFRDAVERGRTFVARALLFRVFDFFPIGPDFVHVLDFGAAENVGVTADQFFHEGARDFFEIERAAFAGELAMEDDLRIIAQCPDCPRLYHALTTFRGSIVIVASSLRADLAQVIAGLKDRDGKILIPGFYDKVAAPSADELKAWKRLPFSEQEYRAEVGSRELVGETEFSVLERTWVRPTMDVHGMPGGFIGAGAKTVIPAKATAKISFRLVPEMEPQAIFALYKKYVEQLAPPGIEVQVRLIHFGDPIVMSTQNPFIKAATRALEQVWGRETVFIRSGGSVPIVGEFERFLKIPTVMMGFGLPDDNLHAPNEKFCIANFYKGIESIIGFLQEVGR